MHLPAMYLLYFPLFSLIDLETDADVPVIDYVTDDPSLLPEQPGKPPPP